MIKSQGSLAGPNQDHGSGLWMPIALLVVVFLTGGASRFDVLSLPFLRFFAAAILVFILVSRGFSIFAEFRRPVGYLAIVGIIILLQLVPLPPAVWTLLPGRDLILDVEAAAGMTSGWRPLAMVPHLAWNSLFALLIPIAMFATLAVSGPRNDTRLLDFLLLFIGADALMGVIQQAAGSGSIFYLYRITNSDSAVGFFSNRNHHALLLACAFPLVAARLSLLMGEAQRVRATLLVGMSIAAVLVPVIVVIGSRAGLLLGAIGLVAALLIYRTPKPSFSRRTGAVPLMDDRWVAVGNLIVAIAVSVASSRYTAFDRLSAVGNGQSDRAAIAPIIWQMIQDHFPFGAGAGSFVPLFKVYEPLELLNPTYYNHAHNDLLEFLLDFGIFGALLIIAAVLSWTASAIRIVMKWRQSAQRDRRLFLGTAGLAIILQCAVASVFDYPLRVPLMAAIFAVAVAWVVRALAEPGKVGHGHERPA